MMILRKMIEKKNNTQKRSAWGYTWTTKTVAPNKKLATKKKRRVVVLLEIVVFIVVIFFCAFV